VSPNPTSGGAEARFTLPAGTVWRLDALDVQGRLVAVLGAGVAAGGAHTVRWSGHHRAGVPVSAGTYWLRLSTPRTATVRTVVRIE
jgi:hypothetical protein